MNVIFLDVDGVLNNDNTKRRTPNGFIGVLPSRIKILAEIVEQNNAKIVLTSTWKDGFQEEPWTKDAVYLKENLSEFGLEIMDFTVDERWAFRGKSIRGWLEQHPETEAWAVIDDEYFFDFDRFGITSHLIRTCPQANGGLRPKHIRAVKELFDEQLARKE